MELATDSTQTKQTQPVSPEAFKNLQALKKQYFTPTQSDQASEAINVAVAACEASNGVVVFNFDTSKEVTEGYAIIVAPINQRNSESKNEVVGVSIGAVPTYDLFMTSPEGTAWIKEQTTNAILAKLANAVRPSTKTGEISATRPYTITDFITSNRSDGVLVAYRTLAPKYIKALKAKGITNLTDATFRQTLQSTAFAEATFEKIKQTTWVSIIHKMIASAEKEGMIAGSLTEWIETRDSAGMPQVVEIDFDGLDDLEI